MTESSRYERQTILPRWSEEAQLKLAGSEVVVVGGGALGTSTSSNLARAGVGKLTVVDRDFVELSNLHRTALFGEADVGRSKAAVIEERIGEVNSGVEVEALAVDLDASNAEKLLKGHDLVLDCTDNLLTRYLVNDFSVKFGVPWIYGAVIGTAGMTMSVDPEEGPCFRCLFPERPPAGSLPTCETAGVVSTLPGVISALQTTEALKYLGTDRLEPGRLLTFDAWSRELSSVRVEKSDECACCGRGDYEFLKGEIGDTSHSVCGREAVQVNPHLEEGIDLEGLAEELEGLGSVEKKEALIRFEVDDYRISVFRDGRAIVEGTDEEREARSLYSKYVGN